MMCMLRIFIERWIGFKIIYEYFFNSTVSKETEKTIEKQMLYLKTPVFHCSL